MKCLHYTCQIFVEIVNVMIPVERLISAQVYSDHCSNMVSVSTIIICWFMVTNFVLFGLLKVCHMMSDFVELDWHVYFSYSITHAYKQCNNDIFLSTKYDCSQDTYLLIFKMVLVLIQSVFFFIHITGSIVCSVFWPFYHSSLYFFYWLDSTWILGTLVIHGIKHEKKQMMKRWSSSSPKLRPSRHGLGE